MNTQLKHDLKNAIYNAKRGHYSDGLLRVWRAIYLWFDRCAEGPTIPEIARQTGLSTSFVWFALQVLEALEIISVSRKPDTGHMIPRSMRLWQVPDRADREVQHD